MLLGRTAMFTSQCWKIWHIAPGIRFVGFRNSAHRGGSAALCPAFDLTPTNKVDKLYREALGCLLVAL
jgi:hypothetical protein